MKIFSWNVFVHNPFVNLGLKYISQFNPDIVCLQEFPFKKLNLITNIFPTYNLRYTLDSKGRSKQYDSLIVTLSKYPIISSKEIEYGGDTVPNFVTKYLYMLLEQIHEHNKAIAIKIIIEGSAYQIVNMRLSYAIPSAGRITQLKNVFEKTEPNKNNIYVGDFNIIDTKIFALIQKFVLGYFYKEIDPNYEKNEFNKLLEKYNLANVFQSQGTYMDLLPKSQPDRILFHSSMKVSQTKVHKNTFFSDHHMISVDLET
jgi:exonuclease III